MRLVDADQIIKSEEAKLIDGYLSCMTNLDVKFLLDSAQTISESEDKQSKIQLLPCPFCGGDPEVIALVQDYDRISVKVRCTKCKVGFQDSVENGSDFSLLNTALEYAAEAWNRRADNG